jgi:hypothetical protein
VAKSKHLPNLVPEVISLQLQLLAKAGYFLEGSSIGKGDGGMISKGSEPLELILPHVGATEDAEDTQGLALENQRLARERHDPLGIDPLRPVDLSIHREIVGHEDCRSGPADAAHLPHV